MGRISTIPDKTIYESMIKINRGDVSLRKEGKNIGMAHSSLKGRIEKIEDYWEKNNIPVNLRDCTFPDTKEIGSLKTTTQELKTTTNQDRKTLEKLNYRLGMFEKKDIPIRKPPTAKEYSGLDYYQLDIEQLRMVYRLLTGRVDKSKGGKASSIKTIIPAIIEGLEFNIVYYDKKGVN